MNEKKVKKIEKDFYKDKKKWDLFLTKHFFKRIKERMDSNLPIDDEEILKEQIKVRMEKYFISHPIESGYDRDFKSIRMQLFGHFVRIFFHLELNPRKIWNVIITTITRKELKGDKRIRKNIKSKKKIGRKKDLDF